MRKTGKKKEMIEREEEKAYKILEECKLRHLFFYFISFPRKVTHNIKFYSLEMFC